MMPCGATTSLPRMTTPPRRYVTEDEDSARWEGFPFRDGDVVVSTRSKHGTTWVQMVLLLLIHQQPELPAPLAQLSPWLDHLVEPRADVVARLEAQDHRRVVKTHSPLDGIPVDPHATYVVVARHPLDAAVSLYHQVLNIDRVRQAELLGTPVVRPDPPPLEEWLAGWIRRDPDPSVVLDSLPGVFHHLTDAWARRDRSNVVLVHYADLLTDLDRQMRALAHRLDLAVDEVVWDDLVRAATLDGMRARAEKLAPDPVGVLADHRAFFRSGRSGTGAELLDPSDLAVYEARAAELAPPDLLAWLHR